MTSSQFRHDYARFFPDLKRTLRLDFVIDDNHTLQPLITQVKLLASSGSGPISVFINSAGGTYSEALEFGEALENSGCLAITIGGRLCGSAAGEILLWGDYSIVKASTIIQIHEGNADFASFCQGRPPEEQTREAFARFRARSLSRRVDIALEHVIVRLVARSLLTRFEAVPDLLAEAVAGDDLLAGEAEAMEEGLKRFTSDFDDTNAVNYLRRASPAAQMAMLADLALPSYAPFEQRVKGLLERIFGMEFIRKAPGAYWFGLVDHISGRRIPNVRSYLERTLVDTLP
jgi:hypothetical protein